MVVTNTQNLGTSVVPDLMRVYESLTQSKPQPIPQHGFQSNNVASGVSSQLQSTAAIASQYGGQSSQKQLHADPQVPVSLQSSNNRVVRQDPLDSHLSSINVTSQDSAIFKRNRPLKSTTRKRSIDNDKTSTNESKPRKKKVGDGRWSKRFAWPDELHRDFVSAVFDVGLKNSSPSSILEQMHPHEQITTERIKSHLQKYRIHRQKSKMDFMSSYESSLLKLKSGDKDLSDPLSFNCGEAAAHLTYLTSTEKEVDERDSTSLVQGGILQLPTLTDDEKRSPVGASFGYLMGLFFSLKQQLSAHRGIQEVCEGSPAMIPSSSTQSEQQNECSFTQPGTESTMILSIDRSEANFARYSSKDPNHTPSTNSTSVDQLHAQSGHHQQPLLRSSHNTASRATESNDTFNTSSLPSSSASMPPPDTRNNNPMEESNMMMRDMQSQMEFQNKMRKLKEQELSKYTQPSDTPFDQYAGTTYDTSSSGATKSGGEGLSIDADFWQSDQVLDEQLFEFLMND